MFWSAKKQAWDDTCAEGCRIICPLPDEKWRLSESSPDFIRMSRDRAQINTKICHFCKQTHQNILIQSDTLTCSLPQGKTLQVTVNLCFYVRKGKRNVQKRTEPLKKKNHKGILKKVRTLRLKLEFSLNSKNSKNASESWEYCQNSEKKYSQNSGIKDSILRLKSELLEVIFLRLK